MGLVGAGLALAIVGDPEEKGMVIWPAFGQPVALLLFLAVPLLVWRWLRQPRAALRFSSLQPLHDLPIGRTCKSQRWGAGLRAAGLVLVIVALAGPRWPDESSRLPTQGIAIAMVVDVSASMAERDFLWQGERLSRLEAVKKVFRLFVDGGEGPDGLSLAGRGNDLISLVVFATRPETACPLTLDHAALLQLLDAQQPRTLATEAMTNPGDAIAWALRRLDQAPTRRKVIVLLSDGEGNVPPPALKPRQAAQLAGNLGIPIYAIDAGKETSQAEEAQPAGDGLQARKSLQEIATISRGRYFQAGAGLALLEVYRQIDQLERQEIKSFQYRRYYEGFAWFSLAALGLWLTVVLLETTVWRRLP